MTRCTLRPAIMILFLWSVCSIASSLQHFLCCGVSWLKHCGDDDDNYDDYDSTPLWWEEGFACLLPKPLGDTVYCSMVWESCSRGGRERKRNEEKVQKKKYPPQRSLHPSYFQTHSPFILSFGRGKKDLWAHVHSLQYICNNIIG